MINVEFKGISYTCKIFTTHVGTIGIKLINYDGIITLEPTVWLSEIAKNEVAIMDFYHFDGMLNALIEAKVIHPPHRYSNSYPICFLYENK